MTSIENKSTEKRTIILQNVTKNIVHFERKCRLTLKRDTFSFRLKDLAKICVFLLFTAT